MDVLPPPVGTPFRRLSLFYFLYFALLGCIAPFWGLYLQARHFSAQDIGLLMAAFAAVRIIAPNIWASWALHAHSPLTMVRFAGVLTALCFACIWWVDSRLEMLIVMLAYGFFWAAMLPQYEAITLRTLKNRIAAYSKIRLWGSVGFIVAVGLFGWLLDHIGVTSLPLFMLLIMILIAVNSFALNSAAIPPYSAAQTPQGFWKKARHPQVVIFIVITILLQISFGAYYTFFSIYLEQQGYSNTEIGLLWALGVVTEVILFWQFHRIMHLLSWRWWLLASILITAIRWWLIADMADMPILLILAQLFHAFSFGAVHAVSMRYIQQYFPGRLQAQGQALYSSVGFGLGTALGAWGCGSLWSWLGGSMIFTLSSLVALLTFVVGWVSLRKE